MKEKEDNEEKEEGKQRVDGMTIEREGKERRRRRMMMMRQG